MPAVAPTDSWKPIAYTSVGFTASSSRIAAPITAGGLRGLPRNTPSSVSPDIAAARSTDGSALVSRTKKATASSPTANLARGPSRSRPARPRMGATNIATFSPDTASRCVSPVARNRSATMGSSLDVSPRVSPIRSPASRAGNTRSSDARSAPRTASAPRINGFAGGPANRT